MSKVFFGSAYARELRADSTLPAKLDRIHGKDPYVQVRTAESLGLGSSKYEIEEVE